MPFDLGLADGGDCGRGVCLLWRLRRKRVATDELVDACENFAGLDVDLSLIKRRPPLRD